MNKQQDKGWLRTMVLDALDKSARPLSGAEVLARIEHDNLDSVFSTLSDLNRNHRYPVERVSKGRYTYRPLSTTDEFVEKVERITRGGQLRPGDLLEIAFVRGSLILAVDSDNNLLTITAHKVVTV